MTLFNGTITPWLLGGLITLVALMLGLTIKYWRDAKRSPYFFLRRQAEIQMRSYSLATLGLMAVTLATTAYIWPAQSDTIVRSALLSNAKPLFTTENGPSSNHLATSPVIENGQRPILFDNTAVAPALTLPETSAKMAAPVAEPIAETPAVETAVAPLSAESFFDNITPTAQLTAQTTLGHMAFSQAVTDSFQPVNARRIFSGGFYTMYATFAYEKMSDGMAWSWLWRYNGEVVSGGNDSWSFGDTGNGAVYLAPPDGFQSGEYTLEIWVNDTLMTQANVLVSGQAAR